MRAAQAALILPIVMLLASCGPDPVLTANGPYRQDGARPSQFSRFADLYVAAAQVPPPANAAAANAALLQAGLSLIANNCSDFFRAEGRRQQRLEFFKDTTTALALLATGALGIARVAGNAVAIVSLSAAGASATISVINRDFLFGADNIDDVRTLVANALAAHAGTVLALQQSSPAAANFDWVVHQLEDNQEICQGPRIVSLTRSAIAQGNIKAYTSAAAPSRNAGLESVAPMEDQVPVTSLPQRVGVRVQN